MIHISHDMREVFSILGKGTLGLGATIGSVSLHYTHINPVLGFITADDYHAVMGNVSITLGAVVGFLTAVSLWRKLPPRKRRHRSPDENE